MIRPDSNGHVIERRFQLLLGLDSQWPCIASGNQSSLYPTLNVVDYDRYGHLEDTGFGSYDDIMADM